MGRGLFGYVRLYRGDASIDHADGDLGYMSVEVVVHALSGIGLRALAADTSAPPLDLASIVKIDVLNRTRQDLETTIALLRPTSCRRPDVGGRADTPKPLRPAKHGHRIDAGSAARRHPARQQRD